MRLPQRSAKGALVLGTRSNAVSRATANGTPRAPDEANAGWDDDDDWGLGENFASMERITAIQGRAGFRRQGKMLSPRVAPHVDACGTPKQARSSLATWGLGKKILLLMILAMCAFGVWWGGRLKMPRSLLDQIPLLDTSGKEVSFSGSAEEELAALEANFGANTQASGQATSSVRWPSGQISKDAKPSLISNSALSADLIYQAAGAEHFRSRSNLESERQDDSIRVRHHTRPHTRQAGGSLEHQDTQAQRAPRETERYGQWAGVVGGRSRQGKGSNPSQSDWLVSRSRGMGAGRDLGVVYGQAQKPRERIQTPLSAEEDRLAAGKSELVEEGSRLGALYRTGAEAVGRLPDPVLPRRKEPQESAAALQPTRPFPIPGPGVPPAGPARPGVATGVPGSKTDPMQALGLSGQAPHAPVVGTQPGGADFLPPGPLGDRAPKDEPLAFSLLRGVGVSAAQQSTQPGFQVSGLVVAGTQGTEGTAGTPVPVIVSGHALQHPDHLELPRGIQLAAAPGGIPGGTAGWIDQGPGVVTIYNTTMMERSQGAPHGSSSAAAGGQSKGYGTGPLSKPSADLDVVLQGFIPPHQQKGTATTGVDRVVGEKSGGEDERDGAGIEPPLPTPRGSTGAGLPGGDKEVAQAQPLPSQATALVGTIPEAKPEPGPGATPAGTLSGPTETPQRPLLGTTAGPTAERTGYQDPLPSPEVQPLLEPGTPQQSPPQVGVSGWPPGPAGTESLRTQAGTQMQVGPPGETLGGPGTQTGADSPQAAGGAKPEQDSASRSQKLETGDVSGLPSGEKSGPLGNDPVPGQRTPPTGRGDDAAAATGGVDAVAEGPPRRPGEDVRRSAAEGVGVGTGNGVQEEKVLETGEGAPDRHSSGSSALPSGPAGEGSGLGTGGRRASGTEGDRRGQETEGRSAASGTEVEGAGAEPEGLRAGERGLVKASGVETELGPAQTGGPGGGPGGTSEAGPSGGAQGTGEAGGAPVAAPDADVASAGLAPGPAEPAAGLVRLKVPEKPKEVKKKKVEEDEDDPDWIDPAMEVINRLRAQTSPPPPSPPPPPPMSLMDKLRGPAASPPPPPPRSKRDIWGVRPTILHDSGTIQGSLVDPTNLLANTAVVAAKVVDNAARGQPLGKILRTKRAANPSQMEIPELKYDDDDDDDK
eukprot:jgi/Botrbrau1/12668/Bobra.67_1s0032.1